MKINLNFVRYILYSTEIILLYVLQSTPNLLPEIFGSKPLLLVAAAIAIAANENPIPALIFGAVCGIFTDATVGFFSISLTIICYTQSYIFKSLLIRSVLSVTSVGFVEISALVSLYFLVFTVSAGIENSGFLFVNHYISRIVYTVVSVVPLYFLNSYIRKKFIHGGGVMQ